MKRKRKIILAFGGVIVLTLFIHSYIRQTQKEIEFPEILYGIPTYQNSRLSFPMSSLNSDPYTAVFLTEDSYEKVLAFYEEKLGMGYKKLNYGRGSTVVGIVYQFKLEDGILTNQISKGVEIIPFNHFNQKVYKASTKIKIMIPQKEIEALMEKSKSAEPPEGEN